MTRSIAPTTVFGVIIAGCALTITACSEGGSHSTNSPAFSSVESSPRVAEAPASEEMASEDSGAQSSSEAMTAAQFAGMGTAALDNRHHMPERLGDLTPTTVCVGAHNGFTRVVIDLEGNGEPGWFTTYTDSPTQQASGYPVEAEGNAFLDVGIEGTPWPSTPELEERHIQQGTTPGTGVVSEVVYTSSFESQSQFIIGLQKRTPYSVTFLEDPKRLVLDFQD
ncbi:AMIN-like domain-containing (lipo)protein [Corynebacterium aurimucosum]|uniref:AMIN-like domain-containing (lipo)protein n=1 Tax=Corynebacterium aurimucosum TaxID=169292 RepID=UPI000664FA6A|nr:hypothetical protein [Corynebacterium aurimucosum]